MSGEPTASDSANGSMSHLMQRMVRMRSEAEDGARDAVGLVAGHDARAKPPKPTWPKILMATEAEEYDMTIHPEKYEVEIHWQLEWLVPAKHAICKRDYWERLNDEEGFTNKFKTYHAAEDQARASLLSGVEPIRIVKVTKQVVTTLREPLCGGLSAGHTGGG